MFSLTDLSLTGCRLLGEKNIECCLSMLLCVLMSACSCLLIQITEMEVCMLANFMFDLFPM